MTSDPLQFYRALSYPVPTPEEWFLYDKKSLKSSHKHHYASRPRVNNITKNIVDYINQHTSLYQSIPFVTHIYLCNSVTFNAPTSESDIDITFVTQE
ncbi:MAG: hypothetical protein H6766_02130 [Candidatus Peribacteria bacterium]|nr:MAG: hypothetical protein H6766_02130 [Candidatus Peribacteria bacterium]